MIMLSSLQKYDPDLFGGIVTISTMANKTRRTNNDEVLMSKSEPIKLIPYHLWNNRGAGEMRVWLPLTKLSHKAFTCANHR